MGTTTIEISRANWQWLNSLKRPSDSFNDVLDRLRAGDLEASPDAVDELRQTIHQADEASKRKLEQLYADRDGEQLPADLDLPGSGDTLDRRRVTIARLYAFLQEQGTASKADFLELVDADAVGYQSANSFWANCVKGRDTLRSLPGVESPAEGGRVWRYAD